MLEAIDNFAVSQLGISQKIYTFPFMLRRD